MRRDPGYQTSRRTTRGSFLPQPPSAGPGSPGQHSPDPRSRRTGMQRAPLRAAETRGFQTGHNGTFVPNANAFYFPPLNSLRSLRLAVPRPTLTSTATERPGPAHRASQTPLSRVSRRPGPGLHGAEATPVSLRAAPRRSPLVARRFPSVPGSHSLRGDGTGPHQAAPRRSGPPPAARALKGQAAARPPRPSPRCDRPAGAASPAIAPLRLPRRRVWVRARRIDVMAGGDWPGQLVSGGSRRCCR